MCFFSSVHLFSYLLFYFYFYVFFVSFFVRDVILHPIRIVNPFIYGCVSMNVSFVGKQFLITVGRRKLSKNFFFLVKEDS